MHRAKRFLQSVLDLAAIEFNAAALGLCWWATWRLAGTGRSAIEAAGQLPLALDSALAAALAPDAIPRVGSLALGVLCLVVAAVLAVSAAEGTWRLLRRIARPA